MPGIKDAVDEIKETVDGLRDDVEKATDVAAEAMSTVRRRPVRRIIGERIDKRLDEAPLLRRKGRGR